MRFHITFKLLYTAHAVIFSALLILFSFSPEAAIAAEITVSPTKNSIQDAINSASPGDIIVVEEGKYSANLLISKEITLRSRTADKSTILLPKDTSQPVISVVSAVGVTISGFTISDSLSSGIAVYNSSKIKIFDNHITGHINGLFFDNTHESKISENITTNNEKGVYLYFSNKNTITKNKMDDNLNNGLLLHASHNNFITENTTNSNYWNGITLSSSNENLVIKNESVKNTYAIVVSESTGNRVEDNKTMRRLYRILPVVLVYIAIMLYLIERKLFILFYEYKHREQGRTQGLR